MAVDSWAFLDPEALSKSHLISGTVQETRPSKQTLVNSMPGAVHSVVSLA